MPDAAGNIKGIALSGKAGETLERIKVNEVHFCIGCGTAPCVGQEHKDACALSDSDCVTHRRAYPECGCSDRL